MVVLVSPLTSLSRMKLMPVSRDSTSNTILVGASRGICHRDELLDRRITAGLQVQPEGHVVRIVLHRLIQQCHAAFVLAPIDGHQAVTMQAIGRAADQQAQNQYYPRNVAPCSPHGAPPVMSCCCWLRGLYVKTRAPLVNASTV